MNISLVRLKLSAFARFQPAAPGARNEQELGFFDLSADLDACDVCRVLRLSVTNFGTTGDGITINAGSLQAFITGGAAATATDGDGLDYDGETLLAASWKVVGLRVISGENEANIRLKSDEIELRASVGTFALSSVTILGDIVSGFTVIGPIGAQSPATVIELLFIGSTVE